jgi:ribosomal protein S27E
LPQSANCFAGLQDQVYVIRHQAESVHLYSVERFEVFQRAQVVPEIGFLRVRCAECAKEKLVTFSCKKRGFCPSCGARRMAETAAHLVDHVIPPVPVRQWVLS